MSSMVGMGSSSKYPGLRNLLMDNCSHAIRCGRGLKTSNAVPVEIVWWGRSRRVLAKAASLSPSW